jgi:predicted DNA-binding transcriptional regulator AlpA
MPKAQRPQPEGTGGAVVSCAVLPNSTAGATAHQALSIEPLLGIAELARVLSCSRRLVERMRSAGRLPRPTLMCGKCPRWSSEAIRRWIEGGGRP